MKTKRKQSGISLIETTVVVAVVATLAVLSTPAINAFFDSLVSAGNVKTMISAAMTTARAIAAKEQRYAGIRFQKVYNPLGASKASQYMIFIVHDPEDRPHGTNLNNGFRVVEGIKPIKLPNTLGVMDLRFNGTNEIIADNEIDEENELIDTTAFSIIFSPTGKMVIHDVCVRNRNGQTNNTSMDDIFNTFQNVTALNPIGMFIQDDGYPLIEEPSRNSFLIYERNKFEKAYENGRAYTDYIELLFREVVYINPYTGTIISTDR